MGQGKAMMRKGWERPASPCPFWKNMSEKAPATGRPSPQLNFNTLCLFHKPLVNQEKVLYFLKLKFDREYMQYIDF
jgi:hypothetical protein